MNQSLINLGLIAVAALLLTACEITISANPTPGLPPGLKVTNASYSTGFEADIDQNGSNEAVICDDRTTNLTYRFSFSGDLDRWESYLQGTTTNVIEGRATFDLGSRYVNYDPRTNTVSVNYEIRRGGAPLAVAPQGIVINPKVSGYTRLYLEINDGSDIYEYDFTSKDIPVLAACG